MIAVLSRKNEIYKFSGSVFVFLTMLNSLPVNAVTIEANSPGLAAVGKNTTVVLGGGGVYTFALKATADGNAVRDRAAEQCLDIVSGTMTGITITGWGALTSSLAWGASLNYSATLSNHCNNELRRYVGLWSTKAPGIFSGDWVTVPANRTCSVNVVTSPAIPDLVPGKAVNAIQITSASTGTGTLAFKPNANNGSKGTITDGTHFLTYSVPGTTWNSGTGQWTGGLGDYSLKLDNIPDPTTPGKYKGNMTATISCD